MQTAFQKKSVHENILSVAFHLSNNHSTGNCATSSLALDEDVVFQQVLTKRLTYPDSFDYFPIYGRVYAGFQINSKGRIENIVILSPGNTKSGFEYQVRQALRHMPSLNPRYAGDYALPVAFCYRNRTVSNSFYNPINKLDENRLGNRLLLAERTCIFDWSTNRIYGGVGVL